MKLSTEMLHSVQPDLWGKAVPSSQHVPTLHVILTPQGGRISTPARQARHVPYRRSGSPFTLSGTASRPYGAEMLHCVQHDMGGKAGHSNRHTLPPLGHPDAGRRKDLNASTTGPARPVQTVRPLARLAAEHPDCTASRCFTAFSMTCVGSLCPQVSTFLHSTSS